MASQQVSFFFSKALVLALVMAFFSAAPVSAQDLAPSPAPAAGAGVSLPVSGAVVGFSLVVSALALLKH
ncbi:hypothetical protein EZV62_005416 [Acer yangbiense]|uniref:Uncharacterized protein n=1 Tax=Acer yangbiense TaxID=1000413 RepID=A0A5C7IMJ6_9ROSI|nr:hypothetical protein EZV62_005416 [Acer yangbiense]